MKTVRQIAEEIGVSKQAVFKKMKREPLLTSLQGLTSMVNGRVMISVDGEILIKSAFVPSAPSTASLKGLSNAPPPAWDDMIAVLQATINTLQGQLEVKDQQIEQQAQTIARLTDALAAAQQMAAAAQALHAGTMHQQLLSSEAKDDQPDQEPESKQKRSWIGRVFGNRSKS